MGGIQGALDIGRIGTRELADHRGIHRAGIGEVLTVDRRDEFATDKVAVARLEENDGAWGTGFGIDHESPPNDSSCSCVCTRAASLRRFRLIMRGFHASDLTLAGGMLSSRVNFARLD
ncbi:hypothetical protein D3C84_521480 [compost metagenome]